MASELKRLVVTLDFFSNGNEVVQYGFPSEQRAYQVRIMEHPPERAEFPWQDPELRRSLSQLEQPNPEPTALKLLGKRLRDFLDKTAWPRVEVEIERRIKAQPPQPVDIVISSNVREIYALPWELLELKSIERWVGTFENCLICYDAASQSFHESHLPTSGRILFAWSDAGGGVPAPEQLKSIHDARGKAVQVPALEIEELPRVTRRRLKGALADPGRPVSILHLLCHGAKMQNGAYGITLSRESEDGGADRIDATELQRFFPAHMPPRLVVLCVCQSGDAGPPHILGSLVQNLHRQGIPAVIASRMPLSVEGANLFTQELYTELIAKGADLRTAFLKTRSKLDLEQKRKDWASLQLYVRGRHEEAFDPLCRRVPLSADRARPDLVLIRHEAFDKISAAPDVGDWHLRKEVRIDQTPALKQRQWDNLEPEIERLVAPQGDLQRALSEPETEFGYYGLPFVPLATLAGYLAGRSRRVHVFEPDPVTKQLVWEKEGSYPGLEREEQPGTAQVGAVRLRISISFPVDLADCRKVLPDLKVRLDLHFRLEAPRPGVVRQEAQARAYAQVLRDKLYQLVDQDHSIKSLHVFAAVPVSVAFLLGQELSATWLPICYIYNFDRGESPRYKWRLCLRAAARGKRSVKVFK